MDPDLCFQKGMQNFVHCALSRLNKACLNRNNKSISFLSIFLFFPLNNRRTSSDKAYMFPS